MDMTDQPADKPMDEHQLAALKEQQRKSDAERIVRLDALALSLSAKRKTAIQARAASGIEQIWLEDEDAYDGVDDLNRQTEGAQGTRHRYTKSKSSAGTYSSSETEVDANVCTLLPNITGPYVDAGAAAIADMLLPLDDWPFALGTTPIPELNALVEKVSGLPDQQAVIAPSHGITEPVAAGEVRVGADKQIAKAKKCAEKAEKRIKDWLTECQWHGKSRRQIDDAARVGSGIVKGPIPKVKKQYVWHNGEAGQALEIHEETKPITESVDYWNLYPDYPACGENIHNGSFVWERGEITRKTLQDLRGQEGYIDSQIELCLREGPNHPEVQPETKQQTSGQNDGPFEVWWFHGDLERADLEAAGCDCKSQDEKFISVPAVITVVNGHPIRAALNHMDKGSFPYDILTWKRRPGMPWGQGISRQIRPAQQAITGAFRALMENAGLSAKPMLAVLRKYLTPTDNNWNLYGGKVFEVDDDADMRDVANAIKAIQIDSRQMELLAIIKFNKELAEDITGQPMLLQGQQGKAPDTVGGMTILNNNASVTKRRIARQFDDQVIEPGIGRYYDYLMQYGEDEEEKGLYIVDARGSSVLVERDIQNKNMIQLLGASVNPAYGADPRKAYAETCRAMKIDPTRLQYDDKEWEKMQAAQKPGDPRIDVAKIRAEADAAIEKARQDFDGRENELDRQNKLAVAVIDERMKSTELTSSERETLAKIKAELAKTAITVNAQKQITRDNQLLDLHRDGADRAERAQDVAIAAAEPHGRAKEGQAFVQ